MSKSLSSSDMDNYLQCLLKVWKKPPSELVKSKTGRQELRNFVVRVRSARKSLSETALKPIFLKFYLRRRWSSRMSSIFHYSSSNQAAKYREKITSNLPWPLKTKRSCFPNDPVVDDLMFFERLFSLQASWRSFNCDTNNDLKLVYEKYKEMWMFRHASRTYLSEAVHMWLEVTLERTVSIVTEWEIHGIRTDKDDIWTNEIPNDVVPTYVQNSLENDNLYQMRMFHHDHAKKSLLFYGLPVGTRLSSVVPTPKVDFFQAKKELSEAAAKLNEDCWFYGEVGMDFLGRMANQYLRAAATYDISHNCE